MGLSLGGTTSAQSRGPWQFIRGAFSFKGHRQQCTASSAAAGGSIMRLPLRGWKSTLTSLGFKPASPRQKGSSSGQRPFHRNQRGRIAAFEQLQDRAMLSVTASFNSTSGTLTVTGDDANNSISVAPVPSGGNTYIQVLGNGNDISPTSVLTSSVKFITVTSGAGDDNIDLSAINQTDFPALEQTNITGGDGNNTISGTNWSSSYIPGDANLDGVFNGADVSAIATALTGLSTYQSTHSLSNAQLLYLLDVNRNGAISTDDMSAASSQLANGYPVPDEQIFGGSGNDTISGGEGMDLISGGAGDDSLTGGAGNDILFGGAGNDTLDGGAGSDSLIGGTGDDSYVFHQADGSSTQVDSLTENTGAGTDTLDFSDFTSGIVVNLQYGTTETVLSGNLQISLSSTTTFENLIGGSGDDYLQGNSVANVIDGGDGDDQLLAGDGTDTSSNVLYGGAGDDILWGNNGNDVLYGGDGTDNLIGMGGDDILSGDAGTDYLLGGYFGPGYDTGNDTFLFDPTTGDSGNLGADWIYSFAGEGNDTLDFSNFSDDLTVDMSSTSWQAVDATNSSVLSILLVTGANEVENAIGGSGDDTIYGNDANNVLEGGPGDDNLYGGSGNDTYVFNPASASDLGTDHVYEDPGNGNDTLDFSNFSADQPINIDIGNSSSTQPVSSGVLSIKLSSSTSIENVVGGYGDDTITGNSLNNILDGGDGNDTLYGLGGDDQLYGGNGDDYLSGGDGNDTLYGLDGNDELHGGDGNDLLYGMNGDDMLYGDAGDDRLEGGSGGDQLSGGDGNDTYVFAWLPSDYSLGSDTITENSSEGTDALDFSRFYDGNYSAPDRALASTEQIVSNTQAPSGDLGADQDLLHITFASASNVESITSPNSLSAWVGSFNVDTDDNNNFTLTTSDENGTLDRVKFYLDSNGNGYWDSSDQLLGTDTSSGDSHSIELTYDLTANDWQLPGGGTVDLSTNQTFFAVPFDGTTAGAPTGVIATAVLNNFTVLKNFSLPRVDIFRGGLLDGPISYDAEGGLGSQNYSQSGLDETTVDYSNSLVGDGHASTSLHGTALTLPVGGLGSGAEISGTLETSAAAGVATQADASGQISGSHEFLAVINSTRASSEIVPFDLTITLTTTNYTGGDVDDAIGFSMYDSRPGDLIDTTDISYPHSHNSESADSVSIHITGGILVIGPMITQDISTGMTNIVIIPTTIRLAYSAFSQLQYLGGSDSSADVKISYDLKLNPSRYRTLS